MKTFALTLYSGRKGNLGRTAGVAPWHIVVSILVCLIAACSSQPQLINTVSSADEVGKRVLDSLQKSDVTELESMRITEQEFRTLIFPGLPIGKIKQWQNAYDYVWGDVNTKSKYGLSNVLTKYGGKKLSFVKLKFNKGETTYNLENTLNLWGKSYTVPFGGKAYTAHEDARVIVKDESGEEQELKLFGAIVEYQGQYKIMSFNIA